MSEINETPWEPLSIREKISFALIKFIQKVFVVDFFDMYRRQEVNYDERDEIYRIGMGPVEDLRDEWLEVYKIQSNFYEENEDDMWVDYCMWLVMRADDTVNPPTIIRGKKTEDGWDVDTNPTPSDSEKRSRKEEILRNIDNRGFIEPVLEESN